MHRLLKMLLAFALITCLPIPCCAQSASEKKAAQKAELKAEQKAEELKNDASYISEKDGVTPTLLPTRRHSKT